MKKWVLFIAALLLLAACTDEETPVANEETEEETNVEETEEESVEEETGTEETEEESTEEETEELSWDKQILSEEGKSLLLSGQIPGTGLSIGSTLADVEAELGTPDSEDFLAGAPLKSYGNIHIAHLMEEEEVVAFHLSFDEPVSIDTLHEAWGEPTDVAPMEIDDMIEAHTYEGDGYVAVFTLTTGSPEEFNSVHVSKTSE